MAWFKPAPTKDHPGEPPPKWAPIGRARRLVLVVPVIAAIVIAFTVVAARTAGATDDTDAATVSPDPLPPS